MRLIYIAIIAMTLNIQTSHSQSKEKMIVRIDFKQEGIRLRQLPPSLDIAGQDLKKGYIDVVVTEEQREYLQDLGLSPKLVQRQPEAIDGRYLTHQEIVQLIRELADAHPDFVRVVEIGRSNKGLPIYAVRFSTHEGAETKPSILFNGMHHAREIMTPEVTTDIMKFLAEHYDNPDMPRVREWIENLSIWVIPQLNPDGNNIVWNEDNWWRKNARGDEWDVWGVDLNRNYPFQWGACRGSSGSKNSDTYRGASGGSEPETQAIMNLVKRENIALDISYHSYSELVVAPYGCEGQFSPENAILKDVGEALASKLEKDNGRMGYSYGTGWELLYPVDGEDISWMHSEVGTIAYVIEVNSSAQGFQPDYSRWRDVTVKRQQKGWEFLLNRLMLGTQARGTVTDSETGELIDATIFIKGIKYENGEKGRPSKLGHYVKILAPGSYELEFKAPGYKTATVPVSVGQEATEIHVSLERDSGERDDSDSDFDFDFDFETPW